MREIELHRTLRELIAPAVEPITVSEAKDFLRVSTTDDDTLIGALITAARMRYERMTGRALVTRLLRLTMDGFPASATSILSTTPEAAGEAIRLWKPPLSFVRQIQYVSSAGVLTRFGDDAAVLIRVTPANVEIGDTFSLLIGGVVVATHVATAATVADVVAGLVTDFNGDDTGWTDFITASNEVTHLDLTGSLDGYNVEVTATTANVTAGTDDQTLTVQRITEPTDTYVVSQTEPPRIGLSENQSWPTPIGEISAALVDYAAGYGGAADVPEIDKLAIRMMVADSYEHRESQSEIALHETRAIHDLVWSRRILEPT